MFFERSWERWQRRFKVAAPLLFACALTAFSAACDARSADSSKTERASSSAAPTAAADTDDFGKLWPRDSVVTARVVSLIPAATELIYAIGQGDHLVGRVTWDVHPDSVRAVPNVGDGIRPNIEAVVARKPSLVLLFATPENRDAADAFARAGIPTVALRIVRVADFERITKRLGLLFNVPDRAANVVDSVQRTLTSVRNAVRDLPRVSVVWPFWHAPVLVAGNGGFEADLLEVAGGRNVFADRIESSVQVTLEDIASRNPELVLVGPTSADRIRTTPQWQSVRAVREGRFGILDTSIMGRPAVTLGMEAVSLARVLHPERAAMLR